MIGLVAAPLPLAPEPGRWDTDPDHTAIWFIARHIGLAEIHGRFNRFSGSLWIAADTGLPDRGTHQGGQHRHRRPQERRPPALVRLPRRGRLSLSELQLRGVARTVKLDTTYLGLGTGMEGEPRAACKAVTELHREDFTLTWQKMLAHGIAAIGTTIRIELDIQVVRPPQAGLLAPR